MDFTTVILFLILYYIRPHEWIGWLAAWRPVTIIMAAALGTMLYRKFQDKQLHPKAFLRTQQDWAILAFTLWILYTAPVWRDAWDSYYNLLSFYVVVAHALSDIKRLERFLWWWMSLILVIAFLGVSSEYGWDPLGSSSITHGTMKGRLVVNLSIFRNPNTLGHSIIPVLPMIYYLMIWKRFLLVRPLFLLTYLLPGWCLYLTQSKGSFLSGAVTMVGSLTVGRPKIVQGIVIVMAYSMGMTVLMLLPRMQTMQNPKSDPGVQGRLFAWELGLNAMQENEHGLGYNHFRHTARRAIDADVAEIREKRAGRFNRVLEKWQNDRLLVIQDATLSVVLAERMSELRKAYAEQALQQNRKELAAAALTGPQHEETLRQQLEKEAERRTSQVIHEIKLDLRREPMDSRYRRKLHDNFGPAIANSLMLSVAERSERQLHREIDAIEEKERVRVQKYINERNVTPAPHCAYVEVGAELGRFGLFLWLSIPYFCLKTLVLAKTRSDQEERIRRLLFGVIIASLVSAWMTNIAYRGIFFIQAGAVAAFHNFLRRRDSGANEEEDEAGGDAPPAGQKQQLTASGQADSITTTLDPAGVDTDTSPDMACDWAVASDGFSFVKVYWFLQDMLLIYIFYRLVIYYWLYFLYENIQLG